MPRVQEKPLLPVVVDEVDPEPVDMIFMPPRPTPREVLSSFIRIELPKGIIGVTAMLGVMRLSFILLLDHKPNQYDWIIIIIFGFGGIGCFCYFLFRNIDTHCSP